MTKLAFILLAGVPGLLLPALGPAALGPAALGQEPSERDDILKLIDKLGGKATLDKSQPERPIVAVDI